MTVRAALERYVVTTGWAKRGLWAWALRDVSWLFGWLAARRKAAYMAGKKVPTDVGIPVIVVGNVIAGGAGKTPVVIAIVQHLQAHGLEVGVLSRGHGTAAHAAQAARPVLATSSAADVGDEPLLLAQRTAAPVWVGADRAAAAAGVRQAHPAVQVLVCDDGLQHLALKRTVEVVVFDERGIGNGWPLPSGPLREAWPRQPMPGAVQLALTSGSFPAAAFGVQRELASHAVRADGTQRALSEFSNPSNPAWAVAGIAKPQAFFDALRSVGVNVVHPLALPDHFNFDSKEVSKHLDRWAISPQMPLLCTEKDAVKLWHHPTNARPDAWAVALTAKPDASFFAALDKALVDHWMPMNRTPPQP